MYGTREVIAQAIEMKDATSDIAPAVGIVCTVAYGSDRYPHIIKHVSKSGNRITIAELNDASDIGRIATRRMDGSFRLAGSKGCGFVFIGSATHYLDPSF